MATVKVKFRKSSVAGKAGTIYYQLCHKQSNKQITTRMHVLPQCWDAEKEMLNSNVDNKELCARYQQQIERDLRNIRQIICEWDGTGKDYTLADVINRFSTLDQGGEATLAFLAELMDELNADSQWGNARNVERTMRSFSDFREGVDIPLKELDETLIVKYEKWLRARKMSKNSSSFYMRTLRSAYNKAVIRFHLEQKFPFRSVYTGVERTRKRAVQEEVTIRLQQLDLSKSDALAFSRDLFIFSYSTLGMSFVDIAFLKKKDIYNGFLSYVRHKTGQRLVLGLLSCAQVIIKRYEDSVRDSPYVFPIITSDDPKTAFQQYQTALGYHNRKLKKIGQLMGESQPFTSYIARHSWATAARNHNVPMYIISAGMGHTSEKTTLIYLDSVENILLDKANEEILRALCCNVSK